MLGVGGEPPSIYDPSAAACSVCTPVHRSPGASVTGCATTAASTHTNRRHPSASRSASAAPFSAHGFHTTASPNPSVRATVARPGSRTVTAARHVEVHAVDLPADAQRVLRLDALRAPRRLIAEPQAAEPRDRDVGDVAHAQVGVQRPGECERLRAAVLDRERDRERVVAERDRDLGREAVRPHRARLLVIAEA